MIKSLNIELSQSQKRFMDASADEVLFGGAAGGGKSYGQLADALIYALKYPGSRQLILRRSYPELEHSIIFVSLHLFPREAAKYSSSIHTWSFLNGSLIEFGYCAAEKDVFRYQGAEYDVIRFDELTHFTESQYIYLLSRLRGVNNYPKQIKSSTNPGGIGHNWVKQRFISGFEAGVEHTDSATGMTRIFIPSFVSDNIFLMRSDPKYKKRLELLPEAEKKALLYGEWDIFDGQVFAEWRNNPQGYKLRRDTHVIEPFEIPRQWRRFRAFDFGYSKPFAVAWFAIDNDGCVYNYRELYGCTGTPDVGVRWTAQRIAAEIKAIEANEESDFPITGYADPAIWNNTGSAEGSIAEMMEKEGIYFEKGKNDRLAGKMQVHYRLAFDGDGFPRMYVFSNCKNMIRTLPMLRYDSVNPEDVDTRQEDHLYDALKYFLMSDPIPPRSGAEEKFLSYNPLAEESFDDYNRFAI